MPGYGISVYGDTDDYYGNASASGLNGAVQWIFLVDWDGDGTFAYNEGPYLIDAWIMRGERYFIDQHGTEFVPIRPGEGTATLTNKDNRFDPDYVAGPLYEKILPGRKFRLMVKDLGTGTTYNVMAGFVYDIPPITERDTIQLQLRESSSLLDNEVSINILYRNSITEAMTQLLSAVEWPAAFGTSLDTESQQITAFTVDKINALDTFIDLGAACLGQVFADNTGKLKFYSRGHSTMPSVAVDQAQVEKQIRRSQPWENLRNIIHVTANKKVKAREEPIWQNSGPIQLNGSSSTTIWVQYRDAIDVRVYTFTANSSVNGTGSDLTSSVTYDLDIFPSSLKITFSASTGYVTEMVVLGRPILDQPIRKTVQNALSTATYGKMIFSLDNPWLQDLSHATEYATMISNFLDEPQRTIQVTIDQRPDLQYSFDLMDKIPFTAAKLAIDATYYVGLIEHKWMEDTGQAVKTTLVMRPRLTDATAISNDPEDPDLPYIPEPPYNPGWPIDIPSTPPPINAPGGTCLTDPAADANGPFNLSGPFPIDLRSNGTYQRDLGIVDGVYIRPSNFTNKSMITVTGDWQTYDPITKGWIGETSSTNWRVTVNGGFEATKSPITDQGSGTRLLTFDSGGGQSLSSLRFAVDQSGLAYTVIAPVASGDVNSTNESGVETGVVIGQWYAIEGTGGPWDNGVGDSVYQFAVAQNASFTSAAYSGVVNTTYGQDLGFAAHAYRVGATNYGRIFFKAVTPTVWIRANDYQFGDNSGTQGWLLSTASYDEVHRWYIRGVSLFNVCGKA
jgi:hypothetical protein